MSVTLTALASHRDEDGDGEGDTVLVDTEGGGDAVLLNACSEQSSLLFQASAVFGFGQEKDLWFWFVS